MSDAEIKRRKKIGSHLSQAGGAVGLTALGGTLLASRGGRNAMRAIPKLKPHVAAPKTLKPDRDRIQGVVNPLLATGAGLGGVGAFNFASYTGAEARKRTMTPAVKKNLEPPIDMGYFGEEGRPVVLPAIERPDEVFKAWEPSAGKFDSEKSRGKRSQGLRGCARCCWWCWCLLGSPGDQDWQGAQELPVKMAPLTEKKGRTQEEAAGREREPRTHRQREGDRAQHGQGRRRYFAHGGKTAAGAAIAVALCMAHTRSRKVQEWWLLGSLRQARLHLGIWHRPRSLNGQHRETEN